MKKSRKLTLALVFALVLTVGVAYALLEGAITIEGAAGLRADLSVIFANEVPLSGTPDDLTATGEQASTGSIAFTPTEATVTLDLAEPGSIVTFDGIQITNNGSLNAILEDAVPIADLDEINLGGSLLDINNAALDISGTNTYTLTVEWDVGAAAAAGSTGENAIEFVIPINFIQATTP